MLCSCLHILPHNQWANNQKDSKELLNSIESVCLAIVTHFLTSKLFTVVRVTNWNAFISNLVTYDNKLKFNLETDMNINVDDDQVVNNWFNCFSNLILFLIWLYLLQCNIKCSGFSFVLQTKHFSVSYLANLYRYDLK